MRERPIIFSSTMVRAILEGRKTQTRRIVRERDLPSPEYEYGRPCPYGVPGDRLWVRETWMPIASGQIPGPVRYGAAYRADDGRKWREHTTRVEFADGREAGPLHLEQAQHWRPSIFMPHWASRITLEVTDVRVQRLQDISHDDAVAEGTAGRADFIGLWENINGRDSWKANPWVWAITFARVVP